MDYKGINVYDKVIIVENKDGQGYVVNPDNKKMLENAKSWAETTLGHWEYFEKDGKKDHKYVKDGVFKPIINEYQNGKFKFKLKHSARGSCQGGKLSFWNCDITAPDGKTFLIGINSDIMLEFLLHTTLVDGVSNDNVWLGRQNGNVGVYTEKMDSFKQAIKDNETRKAMQKATSSYKIGDVVETLTNKRCYLGDVYCLFDFHTETSWHGYYGTTTYKTWYISMFEKPKKKYILSWLDSGKKRLYDNEFYVSKPKGFIINEKYIHKTVPELFVEAIKADEERNYSPISDLFKIRYSLDPNATISHGEIEKYIKSFHPNDKVVFGF